jgi:hypothetical protein
MLLPINMIHVAFSMFKKRHFVYMKFLASL